MSYESNESSHFENKQLPCNEIFEPRSPCQGFFLTGQLHWLVDGHLTLPGRIVSCIQLEALGHCPIAQGFTAAANRDQLLGVQGLMQCFQDSPGTVLQITSNCNIARGFNRLSYLIPRPDSLSKKKDLKELHCCLACLVNQIEPATSPHATASFQVLAYAPPKAARRVLLRLTSIQTSATKLVHSARCIWLIYLAGAS